MNLSSQNYLTPCVLLGKTVTDADTGVTVLLNSSDGMTKIINLGTGESIVVNGNYAEISDQEYTALMRAKRMEKATMLAGQRNDGELILILPSLEEMKQQPILRSGFFEGRFSFASSWETPKYYLNSSTVRVGLKQDVGSNLASISITLYKDIPFWPDTSYGTKTYYPSTNWIYQTWNNINSGANYYLKMERPYDGRWSYGSFNLSW